MNHARLYGVVKSYMFRKRMAEKIDELQVAIKNYLMENDLNSVCVAGYRITYLDGELDFKEIPPHMENQLELFQSTRLNE